jgi:hypothetical protein
MRHTVIVLCIATATLLNVAKAGAQLNRSAVSISGSDSNTCTTLSPCRSIAYALTQTNPGGELIALTSGGYGTFSVNQSVTIEVAPGVYAGITATTGTAISIGGASSDSVVLRGLTVNSLGATNGIASTGGARLYVEDCQIHGFANEGILSWFDISVVDTTIRNCNIGIKIDNASGPVKGTIDHVFIAGGGFIPGPNFSYPYGIFAWRNSDVSVSNTVVADVYRGFAAHDAAILNLESCIATHNYLAVWAGPTALCCPAGTGGFVRASNVTAVGNAFGFYRDPSATFETWGNNRVAGNTIADVYMFGPLTPVSLN